MEQLIDLDTLAKLLTDKGYDGFFLTQAGYPGKVKDSISRFLEACSNGTDKPLYTNILPLHTYLEWNGEDHPKVGCHMWLKYVNGRFDIQEMEIERTDRYGQLLKRSQLTKLTASSVPTTREAIAQVSEKTKEEIAPRKRGPRM
jgi:hypothetical protein